jgi:hypothetical protein
MLLASNFQIAGGSFGHPMFQQMDGLWDAVPGPSALMLTSGWEKTPLHRTDGRKPLFVQMMVAILDMSRKRNLGDSGYFL